MNRQLTSTELEQLSTPIPAVKIMTRREKLLHWAAIIRNHKGYIRLYSNLEHKPTKEYDTLNSAGTAFALAAADPTFKSAGLKGGSVGDSMRFFELSRDDLHELSCDCGGDISTTNMAARLDRIATSKP